MATNSYVQVPPDSTGKKLHALQHTVDATPVQVQAYHLVDHEDAGLGQKVDVRGQAYVRFAEGSPSMDAFGNLRIGEATALGTYDYAHGDSADLFQDLTVTGGSVTHNPASADTTLAVTSANNASISRTTVRYHHYQPGVSNLIIQTLVHGDVGKVGNRRRWGYFDANDGLFWELDGTTLYCVIRSSVSGSVVDTRVAQSVWNVDQLDGIGDPNNISNMNLDITKANFYFIDYAWLGVGEVRFGVLGPGGERNVCHVFQNPNANIRAYMRSGCMPLRWENTNSGSPVSGSEMRIICSAVYAQSKIEYTYWRFSDISNTTGVTLTDATPTPILSMRVRPGQHVGVYPEAINALVTGGDISLSIVDDGVLTGGTWVNAGSVAEKNIGATAITGGDEFYAHWVSAGTHHIELAEYYETNDEGYHRLPDDSDSYVFTLVATKLSGTSVNVKASLNYRELR
jgi:hypothetical protein